MPERARMSTAPSWSSLELTTDELVDDLVTEEPNTLQDSHGQQEDPSLPDQPVIRPDGINSDGLNPSAAGAAHLRLNPIEAEQSGLNGHVTLGLRPNSVLSQRLQLVEDLWEEVLERECGQLRVKARLRVAQAADEVDELLGVV